MRPTLTEAHWKKAGSLVQGWGAVHSRTKAYKELAERLVASVALFIVGTI
jgi:hypothetical protein